MTMRVKRVLAVDNEPNTLYLFKSILEPEGYDVISTPSGEQALDVLKIQQIDLLITDILMPEMDGWELVRKVREELKLTLPIIVVTVHAPPKTAAKEHDVQAIITKPFDRKKLISEIKKMLRKPK